MAEMNQFGGQKGSMGGGVSCSKCEAMLQDALDGTLTKAEQTIFDLHLASCADCSKRMADAQRGAAWLEMLRPHRPEPSSTLVERILAQTSGAALPSLNSASLEPVLAGAAMPVSSGHGPLHRIFSAGFGQGFRNLAGTLMQPRLAMTTAMAFFSIALTMNLTGIHPMSLRASDLKPSSLKRDFYSANTRVVQYYEGLRVVYELESRVHDLQNSQDADATAGSRTAVPAKQTGDQAPASEPGPSDKKAAPASGGSDHDGSKPAPRQSPNPGSSRREDPTQSRRFVAYVYDGTDSGKDIYARVGRKLV